MFVPDAEESASVCVAVLRVVRAPLGLDQLGQPAHFALDGLEPVPLEFEGVAVDALAGAGDRRLHVVEPLFEPVAAALEDAHAHLGVRLGEEREVHAEVLVFPRGRPGLGEQVLQVLLAFGGEPVDDPAAAAGRLAVSAHVTDGQHLLQAGVERAVGECPEGAEHGVQPLAELVAVHR